MAYSTGLASGSIVQYDTAFIFLYNSREVLKVLVALVAVVGILSLWRRITSASF